ncbi:MAG: hypothetical protein IPM64_13980 [Phycisphaerales bacterium]|nr:hypothetical protein [Phycisphaerales bacterium]
MALNAAGRVHLRRLVALTGSGPRAGSTTAPLRHTMIGMAHPIPPAIRPALLCLILFAPQIACAAGDDPAGSAAPVAGVARSGAALEAGALIRSVRILAVQPSEATLVVAEPLWIEEGLLLLVADERGPLAWFRQSPQRSDGAAFVPATPAALPSSPDRLRGWLVRGALTADTFAEWPEDATLHARIEGVSPGGRSAWIALGSGRGAAFGQTWWLRDAGQPLAQIDIRFVTPLAAFGSVTPLVDDPRLEAGLRASLWPTPAQARRNRPVSAIVHVEDRPSGAFLWVPAPPLTEAPDEAHLDVLRDGRVVGHAIVEQKEDRFWFARVTPSLTPQRPLVGDEVRVRSAAMIAERDVDARVFEVTPDGGLLNIGESDGAAVGDTLRVYRGTEAVATLEITRIRGEYATAAVRESHPDYRIAVGDLARWNPPRGTPPDVAEVERVVGGNLLSLRNFTAVPLPLHTPLALRDGAATVGVVFIVESGPTSAIGFAVKESLPRLPRIGDRVRGEGRP